MMPGNGINYEKCNTSKKIDKKKFFFVFLLLECCNTINTTKIMSNFKLQLQIQERELEVKTAAKKLMQDLINEDCSIDRANRMYKHSVDYTKSYGMNKANRAMQDGITLFINHLNTLNHATPIK
jgi:hypothetical protein